MTQVMKNVYVTIYITTTNYNINVIPNPRQGGGAFFSRRAGVPSARFVRWGGSRGEGSCASSLYRFAIKEQFICVLTGSQVFPVGIEGLDELVFLGTSPALNFFSRAMAISIFENLSKYMRRSQLYFFVTAPPNTFLCSHTRFSSQAQTPA
jgi:hypothetical protein